MGQKHVTARVPADLFEAIEEIREAEQTDRSTAVKRLLERGIEDWRIETAVRKYRDGTCSVGRAAERAGLSLWQFLDLLEDRGVELQYDEADLESDLEAVRGE